MSIVNRISDDSLSHCHISEATTFHCPSNAHDESFEESGQISSSLQLNKTTNEFIEDIFNDSANWMTCSLVNDIGIGCKSQYRNSQSQQIDQNGDSSNLQHSVVIKESIELADIDFGLEPNDGQFNNLSIDSFYGLGDNIKSLIFRVKGIKSLYNWQDECLCLKSVVNRKNLIYALPTSGGKTLVAEILMLREISCNKKNAIFILPFVAIVQEKIQSMAPFAIQLNFLVEEYAGSKGIYPPIKRRRKNSLYICTIEKSVGLVNSLIETGRIKEIGIIVVDELHLIGENSGRGATLEGLLTKLMYINAGIHIVGMSATIGNLNEVASFLKADVYTQNFRPVELHEYVKCDDTIWRVNSTSIDILTDEKKVTYRYSEQALKHDPDKIGGFVMEVVPNDSCLIFCPSKQNCENVAIMLTRVLFRTLLKHKVQDKERLLEALKNEGSLCPILKVTICYGIAYHHSGLTTEERRLIEDAFRDGILCVICCTSTLAAGVNLPARRVILRSPYVGMNLINLSKYKQMTGRAGRAGMGEIGESILICKPADIIKVKEILGSKMDDCLSTLHIEQDRGQNNLILSSIMLSLANNRTELHQVVNHSLLAIQASKLGVTVKELVDETVVKLIKTNSINIKDAKPIKTNSEIQYHLESQTPQIDEMEPNIKKTKQSVILDRQSLLELSPLGKAAMKGSFDLQTAYQLHEDLITAQKHLILSDDFHLLYLVAPYDIARQIKPYGSVMFDVLTNLPPSAMQVPTLLGLNEGVICKLRDEILPRNIKAIVFGKFYLCLMMNDLRKGQTVYAVSEKYRVTRGITQNLLTAAAAFTSSVVRFCQEIPEFWAFTELLKGFGKKLTHCFNEELEPLLALPAVKMARAKQLYNAGFKSLQSIAAADPNELQNNLKFVSRKTIDQMIATANLLLMEKVENLKDEYAELMEGLQANEVS